MKASRSKASRRVARRAKIFGFPRRRVRVTRVNKDSDLARYEDLANPKWKGQICVRPSSHPYNLSLISSMISHFGEEKATEWARGVTANLARPPRGGDADQLRGVEVGECSIAIANHYYYMRIMRSEKPEDKPFVEKVGLMANQADRGITLIGPRRYLQQAPNRTSSPVPRIPAIDAAYLFATHSLCPS